MPLFRHTSLTEFISDAIEISLRENTIVEMKSMTKTTRERMAKSAAHDAGSVATDGRRRERVARKGGTIS